MELPPGTLLPRINGGRPRTNEYLYDGVSVLQPEPGQVAYYPIIDAMEEFRLNINSYSPESFSLLCQTAGLKIIDSNLFDHSLAVHKFHTSFMKGVLKMNIRRAFLSAHPIFASRIFTYHFGVLCSPARD